MDLGVPNFWKNAHVWKRNHQFCGNPEFQSIAFMWREATFFGMDSWWCQAPRNKSAHGVQLRDSWLTGWKSDDCLVDALGKRHIDTMNYLKSYAWQRWLGFGVQDVNFYLDPGKRSSLLFKWVAQHRPSFWWGMGMQTAGRSLKLRKASPSPVPAALFGMPRVLGLWSGYILDSYPWLGTPSQKKSNGDPKGDQLCWQDRLKIPSCFCWPQRPVSKRDNGKGPYFRLVRKYPKDPCVHFP